MRSIPLCGLLLAASSMLHAGPWSAEAQAEARDGTVLVACRSRLAGDHLLVELRARDGWHVYAMDNEQRAKKALAGKMSLGVEQNTEIVVASGLRVVGDWHQSAPEDFSQPELRWYSYGFEGTSLFAAKVEREDAEFATVQVRAQACDSASCVSVDAELQVDLRGNDADGFEPDGLVRVGKF